MSFSPITHLRHFGIAVPKYDEQVEFYKNQWGLTPTSDGNDVTYFAAEGSPEQYVTRVRRADEKRIDLVSFGVESRGDVDDLAESLGMGGVTLISEPSDLETPGSGYGVRFFDCEGRTIEVSTEVESRQSRGVEPREAIPVRLSHFVVNSPQPEMTRAWYEKFLGFRLSDTLVHPEMGDLFYFMRCGEKHHSFAIARGPHASLNHGSFEMLNLDDYLFATGRLLRAGGRMVWGPGRHLAGDNTFAYFTDPNGNTMEFTTELEVIDEETWIPSKFSVLESATSDQWGTANEMSETVMTEMFNTPDPGLRLAPPI